MALLAALEVKWLGDVLGAHDGAAVAFLAALEVGRLGRSLGVHDGAAVALLATLEVDGSDGAGARRTSAKANARDQERQPTWNAS